jgi:NAD(P)-dependent dehydrogenase (short-subunit alcohol dehydrogenase family)
MIDFRDKVAVVTGAASGIGLGLARRASEVGMRVVLSDVEADPLRHAVRELANQGATVVGVPADVSDLASVQELAHRVEEAFGPPYLLVNNAGVSMRGRVWELRHEDWEWMLGVNLWGVVHGLETFVPGMIERDAGYIVNTASMAGLSVAARTGAPYAATKHAVVGLTEALFRELRAAGSNVGVSVLCPGPVDTNISTAARNRPRDRGPTVPTTREGTGRALPGRMSPDQIADDVLNAVSARRFWILPHVGQYSAGLTARVQQMLAGVNPDAASEDGVLASLDNPQ